MRSDTLLFSWRARRPPQAGRGQAGQGELAGGAGFLRRRLAPCPAPLPAGRLGWAAAWTSLKAQQGPLWGGSLPEPLS